jgi:predicted ArsR family transcriptional regulator
MGTRPLSPIAAQVLALLENHGVMTAHGVGFHLRIDPAHARDYLRRLEARKLVERNYTARGLDGRIGFVTTDLAAAELERSFPDE